MTLTALYIDDVLIAGDNNSELQLAKAELCKRFKMKDLGETEDFLGLPIARNCTERALIFHKQIISIKY